jgi:hypothetical protein
VAEWEWEDNPRAFIAGTKTCRACKLLDLQSKDDEVKKPGVYPVLRRNLG